ncbi:MAG: phosphatase PAP2 family protein [Candidatus Paceibacterota bacterium]
MTFVEYLIYFCAVVLPWVMGGGLIVYLIFTKKKISALRLVGLSFFSALLAWFLASLVKYNFPSPRPFEVYAHLKPLFTTAQGDAFPSGHATFIGALAVGVFLQRKKLGLIFILGAVLVAAARVLAHVHWPADVIAGLLFGALIAIIVGAVYSKVYPR